MATTTNLPTHKPPMLGGRESMRATRWTCRGGGYRSDPWRVCDACRTYAAPRYRVASRCVRCAASCRVCRVCMSDVGGNENCTHHAVYIFLCCCLSIASGGVCDLHPSAWLTSALRASASTQRPTVQVGLTRKSRPTFDPLCCRRHPRSSATRGTALRRRRGRGGRRPTGSSATAPTAAPTAPALR